MRNSPVFSILVGVLVAFSSAHAQPPTATQPAAAATEASVRDQLQAFRKAARTPAEKVAATDAWLKAHPQVALERMANSSTVSAPVASLATRSLPSRPKSDRCNLRWEIREGWNETLARAHNPHEAVALTDEFVRLNAAAFKDLEPLMLRAKHLRSPLPQITIQDEASRYDDPQTEFAIRLWQARSAAHTPVEWVALSEKCLRTGLTTISPTSKAQPEK